MMIDGLKRRCQSGGGGLVIRSVVSLAPFAYLASAASTVDPTTSLLPTRLHDVDSGIATAMSAWIRLATCSTAPSIASFPPASPAQHVWDHAIVARQRRRLARRSLFSATHCDLCRLERAINVRACVAESTAQPKRRQFDDSIVHAH